MFGDKNEKIKVEQTTKPIILGFVFGGTIDDKGKCVSVKLFFLSNDSGNERASLNLISEFKKLLLAYCLSEWLFSNQG